MTHESQNPDPRSKDPSPAWKKHLSHTLILTSAIFVIAIAVRSWEPITENIKNARIELLGIGWIIATISTLTAFDAFTALYRSIHPTTLSTRGLGNLYFTTQLMKHLPGRFWGIAYQHFNTRHHTPLTKLIAINAAHALLSMYFAVFCAAAVLSGERNLLFGAATMLCAIIILLVLWQNHWKPALTTIIRRIPEKTLRPLTAALQSFAACPLAVKARVIIAFVLGWILYFVAWGFYGEAYPGLSPEHGIHFAAYYAIAWMIGYATFLTPSGIGVREVTFLALVSEFPTDAVVYAMLVGRIGLTATDVVLGLAFLPVRDENNQTQQ